MLWCVLWSRRWTIFYVDDLCRGLMFTLSATFLSYNQNMHIAFNYRRLRSDKPRGQWVGKLSQGGCKPGWLTHLIHNNLFVRTGITPLDHLRLYYAVFTVLIRTLVRQIQCKYITLALSLSSSISSQIVTSYCSRMKKCIVNTLRYNKSCTFFILYNIF